MLKSTDHLAAPTDSLEYITFSGEGNTILSRLGESSHVCDDGVSITKIPAAQPAHEKHRVLNIFSFCHREKKKELSIVLSYRQEKEEVLMSILPILHYSEEGIYI